MTLSITALCHYGECRDLFIVMLNVIILKVLLLSFCAVGITASHSQGDQMIGKKILPNILKSSLNCCQTKKAQIFTSKLNLNFQNIYIKQFMKPKKYLQQARL
jgi:hypothetical protein